METISISKTNFGKYSNALTHETFNMVYKSYRGVLYKQFLILLDFQDTAEDILQDVFLKTWQLRHAIRTEDSLKAYMFRIGRNLIMDHYRRQKKERGFAGTYTTFVNLVEQIDEEYMFREDKFSKLERIMKALPPKRKQVFEMCKLEQRSYAEVGKILAISSSTISDHIVKATRFIKSHWN